MDGMLLVVATGANIATAVSLGLAVAILVQGARAAAQPTPPSQPGRQIPELQALLRRAEQRGRLNARAALSVAMAAGFQAIAFGATLLRAAF